MSKKNLSKYIEEEIAKCKQSPFYFATKYILVDGKPYESRWDEKTFNKIFKRKTKDENKLSEL